MKLCRYTRSTGNLCVRSVLLEYVLQDGVIANVKWIRKHSRACSVAVIISIVLRSDYSTVPLESSEMDS